MNRFLFIITVCLIAVSCRKSVTVTVSNETGIELGERIVEIKSGEILDRLGSDYFFVTDGSGREIPSQLTCDSLIIFPANVPAGYSEEFFFHASDTMHIYNNVVWGKIYPERRDDVAYENRLVGFRIYGPGTQAAGERAFGYDLFLKYPSDSIILPELYAPETDPAVWAKVDSLKNISPELADEFINSFSYHVDHGKGFDPFAVGPTLGAGVAALCLNDSIAYPWCYESAEILDNGPLRFTVALHFTSGEHRLISLDAGSYVNKCEVWFDTLDKPQTIVAGFPLRDDSEAYACASEGIVAYSSPVAGDDSGRALLGIYCPERFDTTFVKDNHILGATTVKPTEKFSYYWGFSWDKTEIPTLPLWLDYLVTLKSSYSISTNN